MYRPNWTETLLFFDMPIQLAATNRLHHRPPCSLNNEYWSSVYQITAKNIYCHRKCQNMRKNMWYAHFAKICEKCGKVPNMRQSHIRVFLTCLVRVLGLWLGLGLGLGLWLGLGLGLGLGHSRVLARCASGLDPHARTYPTSKVSTAIPLTLCSGVMLNYVGEYCEYGEYCDTGDAWSRCSANEWSNTAFDVCGLARMSTW